MWNEIDAHISQLTGRRFTTRQRRSVGGGCINQGYALDDGEVSYFVKVNQGCQVEMFAAEAAGLEEIIATHTILAPKPLGWGVAGGCSYIILEWLEIGNISAQGAGEMGRQLAAMHKATSNRGFGWQMNNTIGSTPQINTWTANWGEFYAQYRLGYQFQLARKRGGNFPREDTLLAAIPKLLAHHPVQPSLLHGDLWCGNGGLTRSGEPVMFDPAVYYGDREADIAMTELFGGFPSEFYQGYHQVLPLDTGYKQRKTLYNLYHILNHFNLFGGGYAYQANRMIEQIIDY